MNIILVMVMSVDGKTTRWYESEIYHWTSKEDQKYFFSIIESSSCIIMGRKTYESARSMIKLSPKTLRLVVTHDPRKYKDEVVANQLEFTNDSPQDILSKLQKAGHKEVLLLGGETLNAAFLKSNLVNELWLTVEPVLFGAGNGLAGSKELDIKLSLLSSEKLNKKGTLLLKYKII